MQRTQFIAPFYMFFVHAPGMYVRDNDLSGAPEKIEFYNLRTHIPDKLLDE